MLEPEPTESVFVMVDPRLVEWIAADEQGLQLRRWPAVELESRRILNLKVTQRDKRPTEEK
jgi:hypothetical protein